MQTNEIATSHRQQQSGIYEFTFNEPSPFAIDMFFGHLSDITEQLPRDDTVRYLVDTFYCGSLPMRYLLPRRNEWCIAPSG